MENLDLQRASKDFIKEKTVASGIKKSVFLPNERIPYESQDVLIIKGLSSEEYLRQVWYRLNGYEFDYISQSWEQYTEPLMNKKGIINFMTVMHSATQSDFSNIKDKEIPRLALKFVRDHLPHFFVYHKEFDLDLKNINVISTLIFNTRFTSLKNALNAGHRNVVRGTMSESVFLKAMGKDEEQQKKGMLNKVSGFFRRRR